MNMILSYYNGFIMFHDTATYVSLGIFHLCYASIQKGFEVLSGPDSLKFSVMLRDDCLWLAPDMQY